MTPWKVIDRAPIPKGGELQLACRGDEWVVRVGGHTLMSSRAHASEETLAAWALERVAEPRDILVGGLGLGFTVRAVLDRVPPACRVIVVELSKQLVAWNRTHVADLAGRPLEDERVRVVEDDVLARLKAASRAYDAILLDVDNGPTALTRQGNKSLYGLSGVSACHQALKLGGVLAVWSAGPDEDYVRALERLHFEVEVKRVTARGPSGGASHMLFFGKKTAPSRKRG
jgi:spermidine synthase